MVRKDKRLSLSRPYHSIWHSESLQGNFKILLNKIDYRRMTNIISNKRKLTLPFFPF